MISCRFLEQVHESTQKDDDDLTMATSFEFLAPSAYDRDQHDLIAQMSSKNEAMPVPTAPQGIPTRYDDRYENPDDKENIPPIEDKENIPPLPISRPFHTRRMPPNVEQINVLKTPPDQSIAVLTAAAAPKPSGGDAVGGDSSVLSNDLQIGVDLINALIDSRGTDAVTKKKLIRKIVRHLLRSKDTKDITQMIMSYTTEKSNSKISGVSTLIDEDAKSDAHNSKVDQTGKDTISGISTLDSSSSNASRAASIEPNNRQPYSGRDRNANLKTENVDEKSVLKDRRKTDIENCEADTVGVKEWLLPVTQSEIEKEMTRKLSRSRSQQHPPQSAAVNSKLRSSQIDMDDEANGQMGSDNQRMICAKNSKSTRSNEILDRLETEKKTQFDWIDQEIEHLKNLKTFLKQINASDSDELSSTKGANVSDEKTNSVYATKHNRDYFTIYENFRRTRKQHRIGGSNGPQADESSTLIGLNFFLSEFSLQYAHEMLNSSLLVRTFQIHPNQVTTVHSTMAKWVVKVIGYIKPRLNHHHQRYRRVQS